ncbi:MAG: 1-deoxy-D-xylulose-5-phosphate synthase [Oscillospiraceae bacterium]|nr:1-deoxy-D-xylulose-5-phosphate synthase [Oscillospiraceae bacterium]
MKQLCSEIREQIIQTISTNGGHLASNLGVVELTVALHCVFESPKDQIVWDVGHQSYTHKMLTGRLNRFETIRMRGGISGFPNRLESPHDPLTSGHSSTSISAALGIFTAKQLKDEPGHVISVIGDGALTGGLAYEGMNNAGRLHKNFIVVLNDNKMSISRNVGSMARYLARIRTKPSYFRIKGNIENILDHLPGLGRPFRHALTKSKSVLKQLLYNSTIFEDMGFYYYGPFDGHDTAKLIEVFSNVKSIQHPVLIHVLTRKGKGYSFAEENPKAFHGISSFNVETGKAVKSPENFSSAFGKKICSLAAEDNRICAITAAMQEGTGLKDFSKQYPERFFDTGIAEEHAITFAGGLACGGMLPVFAVYSSFLQRGYDQLIHDVALQRTKVVLAVDRAGIVGEDGETHQGIFDTAFLRTVPGITIYSPSYYDELQSCLQQAIYGCDGIAAVRYPRGTQLFRPFDFHSSRNPYDLYGNDSADIVLVTYGRLFSNACQAMAFMKGQGLQTRILKLNQIFPIDPAAIQNVLNAKAVYFFEEGITQGGIGEYFSYLLSQSSYSGKFHLRAIRGFVMHQTMVQAMEQLGLSAGEMAKLITSECSN